MKIDIESLSPVQKKINFEIPAERVREEMEKAYHTVQHRASLKGFRAGKVPRPLLERHFSEQVTSEVSSLLVEESYTQALEEHPLQVVTQPQIVAEKLVPGQPFRYSAAIEVKPEIVITNYEGIEAEKQIRTVEDKEVESALAQLAESFAQLQPITDRDQVERDDVVTIESTGLINGRPIPALQGKNRLVQVGQEAVLPGFTERLLGARKGETLQFSLPLPESEESSGAGERLVDFRVTVHDLARKEIPLLDDEFAKDHGECETLAELREKVRHNLQQAADRRTQSQLEDALMTQLLIRNPFEVPPSLVREQVQHLLAEAGLRRPGEDREINVDMLPEALREEVTTRARRQLQTTFLLDALAKHLGLSVPEDELQQRIDELATSVGVERQAQVAAYYASAEHRRALQNRLLHEKGFRAIVDAAKITTVERAVAGAEESD
ncbi:MAG: trigger factor [Candidatus Binatia bacterium]